MKNQLYNKYLEQPFLFDDNYNKINLSKDEFDIIMIFKLLNKKQKCEFLHYIITKPIV